MQGTESPRFRPTVALSAFDVGHMPRVAVVPGLRVSGDFVEWSAKGARYVDLPPDWVLQEVLETSPDDVAGLMAEWGPLVTPGRDADGLPVDDLPVLMGALRYDEATSSGHAVTVRVPVASAAYRLRVLRALAAHYLAWQDDDGAGVVDAWRSSGFDGPSTEVEAWWNWERHVNAALGAFPLRVSVVDEADGAEVFGVLTDPVRTTYHVAILQLARLASSGLRVARCANVFCGRAFTRQRTARREWGAGHVQGVKYCSRACAKAQAERERRARKRAESGGES